MKNLIITAGFAMFAMFFGSGNLVFPLGVGIVAKDQLLFSTLGLIITAVGVPFLGLLAMILFNGEQAKAFSLIGTRSGILLTALMLALLGPFGVLPRCILVAYGGVKLILPQLSVFYFSAAFIGLAALIVLQKDRWMKIMGQVLTPILLSSILGIIILGLWMSPMRPSSPLNSLEALQYGLNQGYQTMDLLAAFFFSATTVKYLRQHLPQNHSNHILKTGLLSCLVGGGLLGAVYIGFLLLGSSYANILEGVPAEQRLAVIAGEALGTGAVPLVVITIFLACITTYIVLSMLFADFISTHLRPYKLSFNGGVLITFLLSLFFSLQGFETLAVGLAQILTFLYPSLIVLSVSLILHKIYGFQYIKFVFWASIVIESMIQMLM